MRLTQTCRSQKHFLPYIHDVIRMDAIARDIITTPTEGRGL